MTPMRNRARAKSSPEPFPPASQPSRCSRLPARPHAGDVPTFAVDASWPKPLPNNWILGQVGGITVDAQGHIWVIHRPRSLTDDEKGAALTPAALEMLRVGAAGARVRRRRQSAALLGRPRRRL